MEQSKFYQIKNITEYEYTLVGCDGSVITLPIQEVDKTASVFTIQDAKDGDVLAWDNSKCIALFKNIYNEDSFNSHGLVGHCTGTFEPRQAYHDIEGAHPATKEQRDLLFQKMKEEGYEWDADKKELKKIIDEKQIKKNLQDNHFRRMFEQKSAAWSEEDEKNSLDIKRLIGSYRAGKAEYRLDSWIDSLKDRVQPKQEWSEEDEKTWKELIEEVKEQIDSIPAPDCRDKEDEKVLKQLNKWLTWLKSLKYRYIWKPSDLQIECLSDAIKNYNSQGYTALILKELLDKLKKLKE